MFKKSKIKIVITIISILLLMFIGVIFILYFSSYKEMMQKDGNMLKIYAQVYWENDGIPSIDNTNKNTIIYKLHTFNSVEFSENGEVIKINNNSIKGVTDEYLIQLAKDLINQGKTSGINNNWVYYIESNNDSTLVVLNYNLIVINNMFALLQYTILFGGIIILILFIISFYLARRIVQPLEEIYQKQKQFISDAGHELKTPLAVISTNAEMLEREFGYNKWLDNIKSETRRMSNLVCQLLELAQTENIIPQMSKLNFSRIVIGGVLPFECVAFEKEHKIQIDVQDNVYILGNAEKLGNLVSILLDNALDYAIKGSIINVCLAKEDNKAIFSVTNDGMEIAEEQIKYLFERFYRADKSRNRANMHYGLGLAIAKAIVEAHNGKIQVFCKLNKVTFSIYIPISS